MKGQVCKPRVLDICMILHHLSCLFFFSSTLLYMPGHRSVDTAVRISWANETSRERLSKAGAGLGILASGWSSKRCREGCCPVRECPALSSPTSSVFCLYLSQQLLNSNLPHLTLYTHLSRCLSHLGCCLGYL